MRVKPLNGNRSRAYWKVLKMGIDLLIERGFSQLMMKATTVFITIDRLAKAFRNIVKPITFTTRILSLLNEGATGGSNNMWVLGPRNEDATSGSKNIITGVHVISNTPTRARVGVYL